MIATSFVFEKIVSKDIESLRVEMYKVFQSKQEASEHKVDIIKWMFIFFISSLVVTIGSLIAIVKFMIVK